MTSTAEQLPTLTNVKVSIFEGSEYKGSAVFQTIHDAIRYSESYGVLIHLYFSDGTHVRSDTVSGALDAVRNITW